MERIIEICCGSYEDALNAYHGGAKESVVKKEPTAKKSATKKTAESKKAVGRAKKTVTKKEE